MATLILNADENIEDFIVENYSIQADCVRLSKIDVIIKRSGHETEIIKSPCKE
jgi:hypothetical protein